MGLRVISASVAGAGGRVNEDVVAAAGDVVVLIDGAGLPAGEEQGCWHGVAWYARRLATAFLHAAVDGPGRPLTEGLAEAIETVADAHRDSCDLTHPRSPWSTVLAVRRTDESLEYLVLADSVLLVDRGDDVEVITDARLADLHAPFKEELKAQKEGTAAYEEFIGRYAAAIRGNRDKPGGFWVASTRPEAAFEAVTGMVDLSGVEAAILLTDGASRPADLFHTSTWRELVDLTRHQGPDALLTHVREIEDTDPDKTRWPRGKVHDDATAVLVTFEP